MTSSELDRLLSVDLGYPGFEASYELWALETYLDSMERHLPFAQDQYRLRGRQDLERYKDSLHSQDVHPRLEEVEEFAELVLPRFVRGAFIVSLWAVYESALANIADYIQQKQDLQLSRKAVQGRDFVDKVTKYFADVLHPLYPLSRR